MSRDKFCILPCNGLDKSLGVIAREVALKIIEKNPEIELICPVLLNTGDNNYEQIVKSSNIILINGCMTRCVTKLIEQRGLKIFKQILIPNELKKNKIKPTKELILNDENREFVKILAEQILEYIKESKGNEAIESREIEEGEFFEMASDKFFFKVPKEGYYFNENDCWIKPEGKTALLGITDYLQNSASDILFVDLPKIGEEIEQFDDVGSFESTKTVLQLISPGSGKIIAVNKGLEKNPEYINKDPYGKGWFIEIGLQDFEEDKELLMNAPDYFDYMREKILKEKEHMD
ncbi:MAG: putative zinc-binding protein [Promethearchaeota archaeon]